MSRAAQRLRLLPAVLALVLGTGAAHAHPPAYRIAPGGAAADSSALSLRLADGSFIRVPCDGEAAKGSPCAPSAARDNASLSDGPRRPPLTRRAPVFDSLRPGVVASVRG